MPLTEHLRELRSRLVKSGIAVVVGMVVGWIAYPTIFELLSQPFEGAVEQAQKEGRDVTLALTGVTDPFILQLQVAAIAGIVLASPVWLYQLWRFVTPGLHKHEKRWGIAFVAVAFPLFLAGTALAYFVLPFGLEILLGFTPENVENIVSVDRYLRFFIRTVIVFGVGFLTPLFIVTLNFAGILTGKRLMSWWRWIIFVVFIFAASDVYKRQVLLSSTIGVEPDEASVSRTIANGMTIKPHRSTRTRDPDHREPHCRWGQCG